MFRKDIRNIAIVAHVDHGKTTLVTELLKQAGENQALDNNELEKERGITILAKNTAFFWKKHKINLLDTPGHADFSGEVERVLSMVDSVLLLVDAVEGPMPQTRFVTEIALKQKIKPIVIINKCDRQFARPHWALDQTFELFDNLGASDEQLDFPTIYCSATEGYAKYDINQPSLSMEPLFDVILSDVTPPTVQEGALQMQISALDYSTYIGEIGIGKIVRGKLKKNDLVCVTNANNENETRKAKIGEIFSYVGLEKKPINEASAGDIVAISGIQNISISDTICDPDEISFMPNLSVEKPTLSIILDISNSPFASLEGKHLTSRQLSDRLEKESLHNVALKVTPSETNTSILVSGRGELHLSVLFETMRREGFAFCIGKPAPIMIQNDDGKTLEPFEHGTIEAPLDLQGKILEQLGSRGAKIQEIKQTNDAHCRVSFSISSRALLGYRAELIASTSGKGRLHTTFYKYDYSGNTRLKKRTNGVLIAKSDGKASGYSIFSLQERGRMLIKPAEQIFEGMIVGIHSRANDLVVNPTKEKQLTNIRAASNDENLNLVPVTKFSLEDAMQFIEEDEYIDITPNAIRLRKKILKESDRKRVSRK